MEVRVDTLREVLLNYLKQHPGVVASPLKGIWPAELPRGESGPAAVLDKVFTDRKRDKLGLTGITESHFSITLIGKRKLQLAEASDAIDLALSGYRGDMGGVQIKTAHLQNQEDDYDHEVETHLIQSTYVIIHENEE